MTDHTISINKKIRLHYILLVIAVIVGVLVSGPALDSMPLGKWFASGIIIAIITCLPLLIFIPTIISPSSTGLSWYGFLLLAYILGGLIKLLGPSGLIGGLLIVGFSLTNFMYVIMWLRPFKKAAKAKEKQQKAKAKS
ncbi:DUF2069 domain-containing protein [Reinekea forsetii]|nr:DUF2069 domain-containing protein [Reinekea forsetii]